MPTLPMFLTPRTPDAWHRVTAPGGYELWRVEAEDEGAKVRVVATLWEGSPTDRDYRRAYRRYLSNPTRQRPPVTNDCIGAEVTVWRDGRVWGAFSSRLDASSFAASTDRVEVRVGGCELVEVERGLRLVVAGKGEQGGVEGEWTFRPVGNGPAWEGTFPSRAIAKAEHRWVVPAAGYGVEGAIAVGDQRLTMTGRGYHDHFYGTGPMGEGARRWIRGRAILPGRTLAFAVAYPRRGGTEVEGVLIEADERGVRELGREFGQKVGADHPVEMEFGRHLRLAKPREMGGNWMVYDATAGGETGRAVCELISL